MSNQDPHSEASHDAQKSFSFYSISHPTVADRDNKSLIAALQHAEQAIAKALAVFEANSKEAK